MQRDGVAAAFGNADGTGFAGNLLPFILRGVRLLGVNVNNPFETRMRLWKRFAAPVTGRMVVDFSLR